MNNIAAKQNELPQLQKLSAQRELYSSAKVLLGIQLFLNIPGTIALSIVALLQPDFGAYTAAAGLALILCDMLFFERAIKDRKEQAVKIQEMFDCEVLHLPKSPLKLVSDVAIEDILNHYQVHSKIQSNIEKIRNWYPVVVNTLPLYVARVICQRANCRWDVRLREKYVMALILIGVGFFTAIFIACVVENLLFLQFILIASTVIPMFQFIIKQYFENRDSIKRLQDLIAFAEVNWQDTLNGKSEACITEGSRRLQDEIYTHRCETPLILDWFYKMFRDKDELLLNKSAEELVNNYHAATGS